MLTGEPQIPDGGGFSTCTIAEGLGRYERMREHLRDKETSAFTGGELELGIRDIVVAVVLSAYRTASFRAFACLLAHPLVSRRVQSLFARPRLSSPVSISAAQHRTHTLS